MRGVEGYDFFLSSATTITPYAGIAYRYLNDKPPSGDPYGYKRESHYYYSPLGIEILRRAGDWAFGVNLEYDYFWFGRQYSHFEDIFGFAIKQSQDNGYGTRASLRLLKETASFNFIFEPFVRYWHIKKSKVAVAQIGPDYVGFIEPDNRTLETGARLGIGF